MKPDAMFETTPPPEASTPEVGAPLDPADPPGAEAACEFATNKLPGAGGRTRPWLTLVLLLASDVIMLMGATWACVYLRWLMGGQYPLSLYLDLWILLGIFVVVYALAKLYPAIPCSPAEELRLLTETTTIVFVGLGAATFLFRSGETYSRSVLLMSWLACLLAVPAGRGLLRFFCSSRSWWGYSVVILGSGPAAAQTIRNLRRHPEIGLKPIAVFSDGPPGKDPATGEAITHLHEAPIVGTLNQLRQVTAAHHMPYAITSVSDLGVERCRQIVRRFSRQFSHMVIVPPALPFSSLWLRTIDLAGTMGVESQYMLHDFRRQTLKRLLDLALVALFAPAWLTLMGVIALAIVLETGRPVLYRQTRIGRGGGEFRIFKFRSMVADADEVLRHYLDQHPELRAEWQATRKLKDDPRITRVGRFLRRTSLDELPQLFNVIRGDMSLVGPRPIVESEKNLYGKDYSYYMRTKPGMTGLWQVSGRNDLSYDERVMLDTYYARNWSVWLDIYLLSRTLFAVVFCRGSY